MKLFPQGAYPKRRCESSYLYEAAVCDSNFKSKSKWFIQIIQIIGFWEGTFTEYP
jgi:hypothetical protein